VFPYLAVDLSLCKKFALTVFNSFGSAVLYHTAIFPGVFDSLIEHEQQSGCCAL